jgi:protein ImuB
VWLALHFPGWQLHSALSALTEPERATLVTKPLAVLDDDRRATLLACNELALARCVRVGHSMNAAIALCADLQFVPRVVEAEARELEKLASFCERFTSKVSLEPPHELLLEIRGSIKLFGGIDALLERVRSDLRTLGLEGRLAVTPTPQSAIWLSRVAKQPAVVRPRVLIPTLNKLPVAILMWPADLELRLARFGVTTIGDLLRLPRAGLARRIGHERLAELDHASGRFRQLRKPHLTAHPYHDRVLLDFEIETTGLLSTLIEKRLDHLDQYLRARTLATDLIRIELKHRDHPVTPIEIGLACPTSDVTHIGKLLQEHLSRLSLAAPVVELSIHAQRLQPQRQHSRELFKASARADALINTEPQARLLEELRARLGHEALGTLRAHEDFRPECAHRTVPPTIGFDPMPEPLPSTLAPRPLWLLPSPQSLKPSQVRRFSIERGPEAIEFGWWDGAPVHREYWVTRSARGALAWMFHDARDGSHYVHGLFG